MLKVTETEETIGFFVTFLSLVAFQLGGGRDPSQAPLMAAGLFKSRYRVLVLRCHYSPPAVFSIKINYKINFARNHNNQNASHNLITCRN